MRELLVNQLRKEDPTINRYGNHRRKENAVHIRSEKEVVSEVRLGTSMAAVGQSRVLALTSAVQPDQESRAHVSEDEKG